MDPLSLSVAMFTILMRRVIDSFYRVPVPKNLTASAVSSSYSTYTILLAALWFFYNQFTKRGLNCPSKPFLAIEGGPPVKSLSNESNSSGNDEKKKGSENCHGRSSKKDLPNHGKKKSTSCIRFIMRRRNKTILYSKNSTQALTRCSSYNDAQYFPNPYKWHPRSLASSTNSEEKYISTANKRKHRLTQSYSQWRFEGEPVAKRTRSGRIYGYTNLLKY